MMKGQEVAAFKHLDLDSLPWPGGLLVAKRKKLHCTPRGTPKGNTPEEAWSSGLWAGPFFLPQ